MRLSVFSRVVATVLAGLLLTACSTTAKKASGRDVDYKQSRTTKSLEVPPDLTATTIEEAPAVLESATTNLSEYNAGSPAAGTSTVLPDQKDMHVERDGDQQWLVIQGQPAQLWPKVRDFWVQQGFLIEREDPRTGIIVTGWAENRADIPQDPIRNVLSKVIDSVYSAATRDQYRVRLERGVAPDTTEIYLTQRGMEEVVTGSPEDVTTTWKLRPPDPELEAEMLKRLMVYLGVEEQKAQAMLANRPERKARAQLVTGDEESMLIIFEDFSRAWRRTGVALDRVGFAVEDRNRAEGIYYVRYSDPLSSQDDDSGLFSSLAFWSSKEAQAKQYQIVLLARGAETQVYVQDAHGKRENSTTSKRILTLLEEQLR